MTDCLFCKIKDKQVSALVVYEDDKVIAFLDVSPRTPGHTLVIPKFHAANLVALPDEEVGHLFLAVKKIAKAVIGGLNAHGATIGINQGEASGQVVGHLHVHILPRFLDDGGGSIQSVVNKKTDEQLSSVADKILQKIKNPS